MNEIDPIKIKRLSKGISSFNKTVWSQCCLDVMKQGLLAKFTQNEHLREKLLATNTNILIEASATDSFFGCGMSLGNKKIWEKNSFLGKAQNHLGRLLAEVRQELR